MVAAKIDSHITLVHRVLSETLRRRILAELSPRNPKKDRAIAERVPGAKQLPDEIHLWREEDKLLILPRGYAHRLEQLAREVGEEVSWESRMTLSSPSEHLFRGWPPAQLRDYQVPMRDAMLEWGSGLAMAPTGSGKSAVTLEVIRWAGQRTLIIVDKTALAAQWAQMAREAYGYEVGMIGEGEWLEKGLTIALRQSLWSRRESLDDTWRSRWGAVILDECHHGSAETLSEIIQWFPAYYRLGVSATPEWDPLLFPIVEAVVGPVIHRTTHDEVGEKLVRPSVRVVSTDFFHEYRPTRMVGRKRVSNNYGAIMAALCADHARCDLLARIAREEAQEGHHVLVVTRRLDQLRALVERLEKTLKVGRRLLTLTGDSTGAQSRIVADTIRDSDQGTVLISTVADEALDIPRLDRLVLAFPVRRVPLVEQQAGRIMRPAPGKEDAVVYDVADPRVPVLRAQQMERARLYVKRGWRVEHVAERAVA